MGATSGADIIYSSGEPGVTPLSSYMICHRICKMCATSGADITYSSGEPGVSLGFFVGFVLFNIFFVYGHNVTSNKTNIRS